MRVPARDSDLGRDLAICARHVANMDEIGLTPRQKVIARSLIRCPAGLHPVYLYYTDRLDYNQIGEILGIHTSNVSRAIQRAVRKVYQGLELVDGIV